VDSKESPELEIAKAKPSLLQELQAAIEENLRQPDVLQSTRKIETALTREQKKKMTRREFLQGLGILGVAGTLVGSLILSEQEETPRLPTRFAREAEKVKPGVFREILGFEPKICGFEPVMQINNKNKRFIVHIGQFHPAAGSLAIIRSEEIAQNQRNIERVLEQGQFEAIFVEGVSEESKEILVYLRKIKERMFDPLKPDALAWQQLVDHYFQVEGIAKEHQCPICQAILDYIVLNKIKELENDFQTQPLIVKPEEQEVFVSAYEIAKSIEILASSHQGRESEAVLEAPFRMFIDGKIEIYPTETLKENQEAAVALSEYEKKLNQLDSFKDKKAVSLLTKEIVEEENNFEKQAMDDREKVAIDLISQHPAFAPGQKFALVYGAVHDFSQEVNQFNQENPNLAVGLIYLAPA